MKNIDPGLPLFLFNYSERKLHGIYEAASSGQMNINPYGWTTDGSERTPYPAQVLQKISMIVLFLLICMIVKIQNGNHQENAIFLMVSIFSLGSNSCSEAVPTFVRRSVQTYNYGQLLWPQSFLV